jgi:uncharacterized repeat protein (TIGR01451 family)
MRVRDWTGPEVFFAMLATVSMMLAMLLLAFPTRALAAPADLSITKEGPARVEPGAQFDYVLTVSNAQGAATATNVTVTDELPDGVTYDGYEAPTGIICTSSAGTVTCAVPTLAAGESKTITLTVHAPPNAGEITNRASASSADDPDSPVNSNEVTTTVAPKLLIDKLDDPDPVSTEGLLLYTLRVQNQGDGYADGAAVTDALPLDAVDFVTVDSHDFDCQYKAGVVQCNAEHSLAPGEIAKVEIVVEPEKAGTIQNTGAVFAQGIHDPLATDTESTVVKSGGGGGGTGPGSNPGTNPGPGNNLPQGEQCSPVVKQGTNDPIGVISGTTPQRLIFTNTFNDTLPLRILYATSSENGSLNITVTPKQGGNPILDKTIQGKKSGVFVVDTKSETSYDIVMLPKDQGYAVLFEMGVGPVKCHDPSDLKPESVSGGSDTTNGETTSGNGTNGGDTSGGSTTDNTTGANDVIGNTVSDHPLPPTGGPPLLGLAVIALGLAVSGACVVRAGILRRDR